MFRSDIETTNLAPSNSKTVRTVSGGPGGFPLGTETSRECVRARANATGHAGVWTHSRAARRVDVPGVPSFPGPSKCHQMTLWRQKRTGSTGVSRRVSDADEPHKRIEMKRLENAGLPQARDGGEPRPREERLFVGHGPSRAHWRRAPRCGVPPFPAFPAFPSERSVVLAADIEC